MYWFKLFSHQIDDGTRYHNPVLVSNLGDKVRGAILPALYAKMTEIEDAALAEQVCGIQGAVERSEGGGSRAERANKEFMEHHGFTIAISVERISCALGVVYVCREPDHVLDVMFIEEGDQIHQFPRKPCLRRGVRGRAMAQAMLGNDGIITPGP